MRALTRCGKPRSLWMRALVLPARERRAKAPDCEVNAMVLSHSENKLYHTLSRVSQEVDLCWRFIYYAPMDKAITVSKTYRVTMTADEHRAVRVYCANHDTKASELIAKFLKRLIAKENNSLVAVAEMHESENT